MLKLVPGFDGGVNYSQLTEQVDQGNFPNVISFKYWSKWATCCWRLHSWSTHL